MTLSILIATLDERAGLLAILLEELTDQIEECNAVRRVEVLTEMDSRNSGITTGAKRNLLLQRATGKYIIYIDDDDKVSPCYIEELLKAAESDADCFAINGTYTLDGSRLTKWYLSKDNANETVHRDGENVFLRTTNHITAVKREIALKGGGFPDKSNAEDKAYSESIHPYLKTEYTIQRPMYWYRCSSVNKTYK